MRVFKGILVALAILLGCLAMSIGFGIPWRYFAATLAGLGACAYFATMGGFFPK